MAARRLFVLLHGAINEIKRCNPVHCCDKDCLEDLRVYFTHCGQAVIDRCINVKCRKAELIYCYIDVESVAFNRGFYSVDVRYFYRVSVDAFAGMGRPTEVTGLATFDKRVILFGSEGNAKIFSSVTRMDGHDVQLLQKANMPTAVVECVDYKLIKRPRLFVGDAYYLFIMTLQYQKGDILWIFTLHAQAFFEDTLEL